MKNTIHQKDNKRIVRAAGLLLLTVWLLNGCAAGKAATQPQYRYGHPEYAHLSDLPQNRPSAAGRHAEPADPMPEVTAAELEAAGDAMLKQKKFPLAYLRYKKSLLKKPGTVRVENKIGLTYLMAGKLEEARSQFEKVSERAPESAATWQGLGQISFLKKAYDDAEAFFLKALSLNPDLWESHNFLGYLYDLRKDHVSAIGRYRSALALQPDRGSIYNNLGVSYSLAGRFPEAVEAFKTALSKNYIHKKVYNNLGLVLAGTGRYEQALTAFKRGVGEPLAYNNLGSLHMRAGNYDAAINCFETAVDLDPRFNAGVRKNLKLAQLEKQKKVTAMPHLSQIKEGGKK